MAREKRKKSKAPIIIILILLIAALVGGFFIFGGTRSTTLAEDVRVTIPDGSTADQVANILDENDLVTNSISFKVFIKSKNAGDKLKAGEYVFPAGKLTYSDILIKLMEGSVVSSVNGVRLTIPEGLTVYQIGQRVEESGIASLDEFLYYAGNLEIPYDYIPQGTDYIQLEGFLYPDTYFFNKGTSAEQVVDTLLAEFNKKWTVERQARADELGLTAKEVITLASLVEEEARLDSERPMIASVIYNRIETGMKLQIDATIQYLTGHKERVLYSDLEIDSPYNTYKYTGMPPGPIAAPGAACIDAVLYPADTNYLFYQTTDAGDGSHYFCETYEEHLAYKESKGN